ncbi:MAG: Oxygen-independent coproporphyrinogen-III oxidase 1 [Pelotomaculum sp. PtaU1.Bin035]|nr:MAG: Oxygen-independent coproporphyrinogen-III oxidase 1 [Pelotomaculum sp. PtaU1.Bin035]
MDIRLYIHVPFCVKKCRYCNFTSYIYSETAANAYFDSLLQEIKLYSAALSPREKSLSSIFIGGGTPTCLPVQKLKAIINNVRESFHWLPGCEVTIEANPGTVDRQSLFELRQAGANRVSLGVQAFQDCLLDRLGRIHTTAETLEAVSAAREAGFENLNMDLIFGIPGQTGEDWLETLSGVVSLSPEHISVYGLQLEEGTPMERAVARRELQLCSEELELFMYQAAIRYLTSRGYVHYEISNFARPDRKSAHNLGYWLNQPYLGLGPGAHSYLRGERFANETTLVGYAGRLSRGEMPVAAREDGSVTVEMSETVFLGLRLLKGIDLAAFYRRFGRRIEDVYGKEIVLLKEAGLVEVAGGYLRLTSKGLPVANVVFMEFI